MIEQITKSEIKSINKATEQIHAAAQFLAMAEKHLSESMDDDAHTNLGWLTMKEKFITRPLGGNEKYFLFLKPETLEIGFLDSANNKIDQISLKRKTKKEVTKWIKAKTKELEINVAKFKMDIHYDLPEYANQKILKFKRSPRKAFLAFSKLRSWAEHFINKHKLSFPFAQETRTWPHHFDHATHIPLTKLKSGEVTKSISIGLAIHDGMINEPYFYVSAWVKNKELDLSKLEELSAGYWLNDGFKGAVLPIFDLMGDEDLNSQETKIDAFFEESMKALLTIIKYNPKAANAKQ